MVFFTGAFWVFFSTLLVALFSFINIIFHRVAKSYVSRTQSCCNSTTLLQANKSKDSDSHESTEAKPIVEYDEIEKDSYSNESMEAKSKIVEHEETEGESPKLIFKFPTYEEFLQSKKGPSDLIEKSECLDEKVLDNSLETAEELTPKRILVKGYNSGDNFMQQDMNVESDTESMLHNSAEKTCEESLMPEDIKVEPDNEDMLRNSADKICEEEEEEQDEELEKHKAKEACKEEVSTEVIGDAQKKMSTDQEDVKNEEFLSEKDVSTVDSDSESVVSSLEFSLISHLIDSYSDGLLSDKDFDSELKFSSPTDSFGKKVELTLVDSDIEDMILQNSTNWQESDSFGDEDSDILEELKALEESQKQDDSPCKNENSEQKNSDANDNEQLEPSEVADKSLKPISHGSSDFDSEDPNGLESLWEHQDFLEQLQMDINKGRAFGLPTIEEEEPNPPKIIEDLKPWKIDEKFQHGDRMSELYKFYKSYRDRMRKFDILNFQKLYAIGFLQKKDPVESISICKASPSPAITSLLLDNFRICRPKKSQVDPMAKAIREWRSDLEVVYVGQLCLSWEILHWQYEKVLELWEADPYRSHLYNEVAGKFQEFQVLLQRFLENEPFEEGSRVQLYIKNRCVRRSLLQVPVVKEDSLKDIKKAIKEGNTNAITRNMLIEIMEESIRIFWQFVRADKDTHHTTLSRRKTRVELQEPADSQLLLEVKDNLEKKEKKLKDLMRSGNCILKRFQKHQDDGADQVLCFFSQVDMKLVRRVLNMSRLNTEQLLWCRDKLGKVSFVGRKIHVDPLFLLFPC